VWVIEPKKGASVLYTIKTENFDFKAVDVDHGKEFPIHEHFQVKDLRTNMNEPSFIEKVGKIQEYIRAGDIYQANLTREISGTFSGDVVSLAHKLLESNNIEFGCFMVAGQNFLISTSPERFFKVENDVITVSPIKGTAPRGESALEDAERKHNLLNDKKNLRELAMIVDLLRNDISRVCKAGTVKVDTFPVLKTLRNVHHLVADISGKLEKKTFREIMIALFPGGSISGCPKIRACQIIEELENQPRGPYTGSLGYICKDGTMDFNILIRTLFVCNEKICFNVGGGITLLSHPLDEFDETNHKALNILAVLEKK
jgi:para-aminobenzoate synthetase component 1